MIRSGTGWDAAAVAALLLPLAGLAAPLTGDRGRRRVVEAGRRGALLAAGIWVLLVASAAAPGLGRFDPDPTTMAAAAATTLLAAGLAVEGPAALGPATVPSLAPVLAGAAVLVLGLVDAPSSPSGGGATAWVLVGAGGAALVAAVAAGEARDGPRALGVLLVPAGLLVALRAVPALPADPSELAGLAAAGAAALVGGAALRRPTWAPGLPVLVGLLVAAVALAPVAAVRPWAALVAAGAALAVTPTGGWRALGLAPGLGAVVATTADVPAGGVGAAAHLVWAGLAAIAVVGVVAAARARPGGGGRPPVEVLVVTASLVGWLAVAPGSWQWAVPDTTRLAPWDRAAAVGAAAAAVAVVLHALADRRPGWIGSAPDRPHPPVAR